MNTILSQSCKMAAPISKILMTFSKRSKTLAIPENDILVTADVIGLYPNTTHNAGHKALNNMLEEREYKAVRKQLISI